MSAEREFYRHKKTGGIYEVICNAQDESAPERIMVVYRSATTGDRWVRPSVEFNDGRFERLEDDEALLSMLPKLPPHSHAHIADWSPWERKAIERYAVEFAKFILANQQRRIP